MALDERGEGVALFLLDSLGTIAVEGPEQLKLAKVALLAARRRRVERLGVAPLLPAAGKAAVAVLVEDFVRVAGRNLSPKVREGECGGCEVRGDGGWRRGGGGGFSSEGGSKRQEVSEQRTTMPGIQISKRLAHLQKLWPCGGPSAASSSRWPAWHISWASVSRSFSSESITFGESSMCAGRVPCSRWNRPAVVCKRPFHSTRMPAGSSDSKTRSLYSAYSAGASCSRARRVEAKEGVFAPAAAAVGVFAPAAAAVGVLPGRPVGVLAGPWGRRALSGSSSSALSSSEDMALEAMAVEAMARGVRGGRSGGEASSSEVSVRSI